VGKPVIVSDNVGCAEDLVRPGWNGLIFPAGDVDALAGCLREALADPGRLTEWGRNSQDLIREYSYETATRGLLEALKHVVPRASGGGERELSVKGKVSL
jgi:glycosyltransferase involved in cell wall biosynthesis